MWLIIYLIKKKIKQTNLNNNKLDRGDLYTRTLRYPDVMAHNYKFLL